jgi:hypothetical protein
METEEHFCYQPTTARHDHDHRHTGTIASSICSSHPSAQ